MTSTPPSETADPAPTTTTNTSNLLVREDTTNEGYTGFDPSSGLYYYTNGVDQPMFYDGFNNRWLYWNQEGQYYYPVGTDGSVNPATAKNEETAAGMTSTLATGAASASLGVPSAMTSSVGSSSSAIGQQQQQQQQQSSRKVPDDDKRPLPFRLTSAIQSERERLLGKSTGHAKKRAVDWGAALDNVPMQGFGGRGGGLGHFSNPPILPPRFYYPHAVPGTYYDFLNVRPNASVEEIEESVQWWELVGYPRAAEADLDRAERIHRLVLEAALIITNSSLRAQYDQTLPLGGKGKAASGMSRGHGMLDVSTYVPRVLHFHQGDGELAGSRSSSRPGSVSSTPSKYPTKQQLTPGSEDGLINNNNQHQALLEEDLSQPSITERLFAAVSEGIFGPPRTKPRNKKYAAKGMEWIEEERRRLVSGSNNNDGGNSEMYNGEAAAPNSGFKVTNTTTNQSKHTDPSSNQNNNSAAAVKPPF